MPSCIFGFCKKFTVKDLACKKYFLSGSNKIFLFTFTLDCLLQINNSKF